MIWKNGIVAIKVGIVQAVRILDEGIVQNQISGGYGEHLNLKHYIVITMNYGIGMSIQLK